MKARQNRSASPRKYPAKKLGKAKPASRKSATQDHSARVQKKLEACQTRVLKQIAVGRELAECLDIMLRRLEACLPGVLCSIVLLDVEGKKVWLSLAPSLPDLFTRGIEGESIDSLIGTCGTAALCGKSVIVEDFAKDPLWQNFKELAVTRGLDTCWSTPIRGSQRRMMGTFAMYYGKPRRPTHAHRRCADIATSLTSIAVLRHRDVTALRESEEKFSKVFHSNPAILALSTLDGKNVEVNQAYLNSIGRSREEVIGKSGVDMMVVSTEERKRIVELTQKTGGSVRNAEITVETVGGKINHLLVSAEIIYLGGVPHRLTTLLDITPRKRAEEELRESEARLRLSVAASNIGLWDWNLVTNEVHFSPEWKSQLGYAGDEISNRFEEWESRVHPDDLGPTLAKARSFIENPDVEYAVEFRLRHKDGSYRWILAQAQVFRDAANKPIRMMGCHVDITERKRVEQSLREKERLLSESQRLAKIGSWKLNPDGTVVWSDETYRIYGVSRDAFHITVESFYEMVFPEDRAHIRDWAEKCASGKNPNSLEFRAVRPDGSVRYLLCAGGLISAGDRSPAYMVGTVQDITERKQAEDSYAKMAEKLEAVFANAPIAMWVANEHGTLVMQNVMCQKLSNIDDADIVGKYNLFKDNVIEKAGLMPLLRSVYEEGQTVNFIVDYPLADVEQIAVKHGTHRMLDVTIVPLKDRGQRVTGAIVMQLNLTERAKAELELKQLTKQLRALLARLHHARAEERLRVAREIHDELGQALTGLKMDLRWLERRLSNPGVAPALKPLLDRAVGASALIDTTITTVQQIAAQLRPSALDKLGLAAALRQEARRFQERFGVRCAVAEVTLPAGRKSEATAIPMPAMASEELFYICQEVLTNVARHARATSVEIRLKIEGQAVTLEVSDDGIGMSEAQLCDPSSLGLLGMRERATQCGGHISFHRNEPHGTKVAVKVPGGGAAIDPPNAP